MAYPMHIRGNRLIAPTFSAKKKPLVRSKFGCAQKKFLYASFAVGKTIAEEDDIASQSWVLRNRMVRLGIKSVVDAIVGTRACIHVALSGFWSAAVRYDCIVAGDGRAEGITGISLNAAQRCGSIDVPEDDCAIRLEFENAAFEEIVIHPESAVFNYNVCFGCQVKHCINFYCWLINDCIYVREVALIVMLL